MSWFNDRGILAKLLGTFAAVCVIMGVVGYLGLTTAQSIKAHLNNVGGNTLPSTRDVAVVEINLVKVQRDLRSAVLTSDATATNGFLTKASGEFTTLEQSFAAYKALPTSDAERADRRL